MPVDRCMALASSLPVTVYAAFTGSLHEHAYTFWFWFLLELCRELPTELKALYFQPKLSLLLSSSI